MNTQAIDMTNTFIDASRSRATLQKDDKVLIVSKSSMRYVDTSDNGELICCVEDDTNQMYYIKAEHCMFILIERAHNETNNISHKED